MIVVMLFILLALISSADAVTLTGSSEYAVPGSDFTLTCDVREEANAVSFYRRPDASTPVGSIQIGGERGSQCFNPPDLCKPDVCSCVTTSTGGRGTVFRWAIQPQTEDHGSMWFCRRINLKLADQILDSPNYTLSVAAGPGNSILLSPSDTVYTKTEGDTLPDITCTADCRPGCTYVWTKHDNTNFTTSAVLSLGQLDRSEHGEYSCTARNTVGESATIISVAVQYGPGNSVLLQPQQSVVDIVENQTLPNVNCSADCRPSCSYTWSKSGKSYTNPLSLSVATRDSAGQYTCTASNTVSGETKMWSLIVRFPPRIQVLTHTEGGADVTENGPKTLICTIESFPPSTIQWYFKANNSFFFTTSDVLESTYTLTTVGCHDTGLYTCSARNSVSDTAVTKDIHINVLCKPRPYTKWDYKRTFDLATSDTLVIPAMFISNPKPVFTWTFQLTPSTSATELVNGVDNFVVQNSFEMKNVSAVSLGIRTTMQDNWFGLYNVTATNSQGSTMVSFTVRAQLCGDTSSFYRQLFVTSIVLTCVSVIILLINLGIGVFVTRFGHLPFMKRRMNRPNTSPQPFSSIEESGNAMAGIASGQERSMYTELDTTDFAAQNVYDQARPAHDIVLDGRAERSNYETLGEVSGPNVYEELKERRGSS